MNNICINCIRKDVCYKYRLNYVCAREGTCTNYYEMPKDEILENNKNLCKHCEELKEENKMLSDAKENLEKKVEFFMQQIRLWRSSEQQVYPESDCAENMNEQETFIEEEKKWSYEQGYKDGSIEGSAEEYDKGWRQGFLDCLDNKGCWEEIEILPEVYDVEGVKTWASKMMCSKCGFTTIAIEGKLTQYNGCPNCFADMREADND